MSEDFSLTARELLREGAQLLDAGDAIRAQILLLRDMPSVDVLNPMAKQVAAIELLGAIDCFLDAGEDTASADGNCNALSGAGFYLYVAEACHDLDTALPCDRAVAGMLRASENLPSAFNTADICLSAATVARQDHMKKTALTKLQESITAKRFRTIENPYSRLEIYSKIATQILHVKDGLDLEKYGTGVIEAILDDMDSMGDQLDCSLTGVANVYKGLACSFMGRDPRFHEQYSGVIARIVNGLQRCLESQSDPAERCNINIYIGLTASEASDAGCAAAENIIQYLEGNPREEIAFSGMNAASRHIAHDNDIHSRLSRLLDREHFSLESHGHMQRILAARLGVAEVRQRMQHLHPTPPSP